MHVHVPTCIQCTCTCMPHSDLHTMYIHVHVPFDHTTILCIHVYTCVLIIRGVCYGVESGNEAIMQYMTLCRCGNTSQTTNTRPLHIPYDTYMYIYVHCNTARWCARLYSMLKLAPQDKSTGQSFTFIAHTVPELLTVFEGSTQRERTIIIIHIPC